MELFRNYLSGRRQCVVHGDAISEWPNIHVGVPQGSILGPLHFSIFVNDLPAALLKSTVMLYADDTTVNVSDKSAKVVEEVLTDDLTRLTTWLGMNGLTMNVHKTQFMSLSRKCREKEANGLRVLVEQEALKKFDDVKYLGVIVDS